MYLIEVQLEVFKKAFDYSSRASLKEFWYFHLSAFLTVLILMVAEGFMLFDKFTILTDVLASFYLLLILLPVMALSVRRLHDINKSGFFVLLNFIPVIGNCLLLALCCMKSYDGSNEFGESLKGTVGPQNRYQKMFCYLEGSLTQDELKNLFDWNFEEKQLLTRIGKRNNANKSVITKELLDRPFRDYLDDKWSASELEHVMQIIEFCDEFAFSKEVSQIIAQFSSQAMNGEITKEKVEGFWS